MFQSGTAYRELRKGIVTKNLVAVVSLPNGIFNPYSGVKTSILFLNRQLRKEHNDILFVDLKNDGYSLGTQRKPVKGNQIPEIIEIIKKFQNNETFEDNSLAFRIPRKEVMKDDFSLAVNKYKKIEVDNTVYEDPKDIIRRLNDNNITYQELLKKLEDV